MKYRITIIQDKYAQNPRKEFDQLSTLVCFHTRYELGDDGHGYRSNDYDGWDELEQRIVKDNPGCVILPLYLYDHSGIAISTTLFSCPWDSGQVGFAFIPRQKIFDAFSPSSSPVRRMTKKLRQLAMDCIVSEVEEYNQYLTGDVWCYAITDEGGNIFDSCCGLFGRKYAEDAAEEAGRMVGAENG